MSTRLIIAGSRTIRDSEWVRGHLDRITENLDIDEGISGMADGPDMIGYNWLLENAETVTEMPAEWDKYGRSAGYRRNEQMAKRGTHLIAFWDGKSRGTQHMIDLARKHNLKVRIVHTDRKE